MEVRTYTDFWEMERKLYALNDVSLPFPLPLRTVGVFALVGVPWMGLLAFIGIPFDATWWLFWLLPPAAIGYFASKQIFERKTLIQYGLSRFKFLSQAKRYKGLREWDNADPYVTESVSQVWVKKEA